MKFASALPMALRPGRSIVWGCPLLGLVASCSSSSGSTAPAIDAASNMTAGQSDGGTVGTPDADRALADGPTVSLDGSSGCTGVLPREGGLCPARRPGTLSIIGATFSSTGAAIQYGTAPDLWDIYTFAGAGQSAPLVTPTASALTISASLLPSGAGPGWAGVGVSSAGTKCVDESNYARGVQFTLAGDLGGCLLFVDSIESPDESVASDACRGGCTVGNGCVAPTVPVSSLGMIFLPNVSFAGGSPDYLGDTAQLIGFRWRLVTPGAEAGAGCTANIAISNVQLIGL